ncbi:MAG: hypothetical protein WBG37_14485 [Desulfobacterales bacterium]
MNTLVLASDGTMSAEGRPLGGDVLGYLSHRVSLAEGYCLRSLFAMLRTCPVLAQLSPFWPALQTQADRCPGQGCCYDGFDVLQLARTVEMVGFPGKPRLEIYISFHGLAGGEAHELRFLQLEHLLDMPIRLGRLKHVVFGDQVDVLTFETFYTLFEMIDTIGWELSFHGTPETCELRR